MTCSVYKSCQQISKQLYKITNDLNRILSEIHAPNQSLKNDRKNYTLAKTLRQSGGTISDWYLRPAHLSSTTPLHSRDPAPASASVLASAPVIASVSDPAPIQKNNETALSKDYIPGTVGSIIADVRKEIEKEYLAQQPELSEKRRKTCSRDYKPNRVFTAQSRDLDAYLEDYIDETDMDNLSMYGTDTDDKLMETNISKPSDTNDKVMSPFYAKLAQLRMEELLLEEERLLELKRIQELIRTRRPRKYWSNEQLHQELEYTLLKPDYHRYMLRSKEFTEELMRNTEMLRNAQYQEDIDRYRTELIKASLKTGKLFWKPTV